MNRKNYTMIFMTMLLVSFGFGFAGTMLQTNAANLGVSDIETPINPVKEFGLSADPAVTAVGLTTNNITGLTTDDLFAGAYATYTVVANVSDADGWKDIDNVTIKFEKAQVVQWSFLYTNSTNTTAEQTNPTYVTLGTTSVAHGTNTINVTAAFTVNWAAAEIDDVDLNVSVHNATVLYSASVLANINLDIQTELTCSDATLFTYNEYLNGEHYGTMALTYHYTGFTTTYPKAAGTDFWITRAAITAETVGARSWESASYSDTTGIAIWNQVIAPEVNDVVTETMTIFAVTQGGGSSGTSIMNTGTSDTVIVNPNAPLPEDRETRVDGIVIEGPFNSFEGFVLVGVAAVVVFGGAYYMSNMKTTAKRKPRKRKRKTTKRKTKRKRKRKK